VSILDGLIVSTILPGVYRYIAKREFTAQPLAGIFLRRLGAEFVERFDPGRSVLDARRLAALARSGKRLVFFPEGTFGAQPGLRPFHLGAFLAAAEAGVPVIPMAIRGTRAILPYPRWLPRRAPVEVVIGAPIFPQGHGWEAAIRLRDAARAHILAHCGEPDLANA
jgi:1-acyl-sn-glycerol-3-phosphate acyltransferase